RATHRSRNRTLRSQQIQRVSYSPPQTVGRRGVTRRMGIRHAAVLWGAIAVTSATGLHAQLATVPLRLQLSTPMKEVTAGSPVTIRATLENMRNQPTAALEDVPVTLIWPVT